MHSFPPANSLVGIVTLRDLLNFLSLKLELEQTTNQDE
jgi:hypothetical protein